MGAHLHSYTKGRQHSTFYLWHQRSEQTYLTSIISHTKDPRSLVETWRIPFWNHTWSKYGILPHELTFKQELDQLEYLKVKKKVNRSQGSAPTFLTPEERRAPKVFWCYQMYDKTWSIEGLPWLQCSVWNTHWCFEITTWRSHFPKGQANRFLF